MSRLAWQTYEGHDGRLVLGALEAWELERWVGDAGLVSAFLEPTRAEPHPQNHRCPAWLVLLYQERTFLARGAVVAAEGLGVPSGAAIDMLKGQVRAFLRHARRCPRPPCAATQSLESALRLGGGEASYPILARHAPTDWDGMPEAEVRAWGQRWRPS